MIGPFPEKLRGALVVPPRAFALEIGFAQHHGPVDIAAFMALPVIIERALRIVEVSVLVAVDVAEPGCRIGGVGGDFQINRARLSDILFNTDTVLIALGESEGAGRGIIFVEPS